MPCRYESDDCIMKNQSKDLDKLTKLLCEACDLIFEPNPLGPPISKELRDWYKEHKIKDVQRIAREQKELEKEQTRRDVLAKLTSQERKVLGLK